MNYFNKLNEAEECPVLYSLHETDNLLLKEKESYLEKCIFEKYSNV